MADADNLDGSEVWVDLDGSEMWVGRTYVPTEQPDPVNSPPHYTQGDIETIDYIVDVLGVEGAIEYCHGNVIKYTGSRLMTKDNPVQDAKKSVWYLNKMIDLMES